MSVYNRVYCTTATTGTGSVTPGSAISNAFLSFATANGGSAIPTSTNLTIELNDGGDFEISRGVWNGTVVTRATVLISRIGGTVGTTKITLSGNATIQIVVAAEDTVTSQDNNSFAGVQNITNSTAASGIGTGALIVGGGGSIGGNLYVGNNLVVTNIIQANTKGQLLGTAGGNAATGALVPGDANVLGYNSGSGNWAGWGVDNNGQFWIRTGLSGTGAAPFYINTSNQSFFLGAINPAAGILFPATQSSQSNVNNLDDYEEGTWTPTVTFATPGNLSVSYTIQDGRYTKVGNLVTVSFIIITSSFTFTTASGNLTVNTLPFTSLNSANYRAYCGAVFGGITKAGYGTVAAAILSNTTSVLFIGSGTGVAASNVVAADTPTGGTLVLGVTMSYTTAT